MKGGSRGNRDWSTELTPRFAFLTSMKGGSRGNRDQRTEGVLTFDAQPTSMKGGSRGNRDVVVRPRAVRRLPTSMKGGSRGNRDIRRET